MRRLFVLLPILLAAASPATGADEDEEDPLAGVPQKFRDWLARVELLITGEERDYLLTLDRDFRRNAGWVFGGLAYR